MGTGTIGQDVLTIHIGEVALKGKNRRDFERQLFANIKAKIPDAHMIRADGRFILETKNLDAALGKLGKIFGISWFSKSVVLPPDVDGIAKEIAERIGNERVKIETRRVDKRFPKTSVEISKEIAGRIAALGKNPVVRDYERIVLIEILRDMAIITFERNEGAGGLPYGSSGRLLSLLSGGIDSPVAAWLMMSRGCELEFLHVHAQPSSEAVKKSKITALVSRLAEYAPNALTLHLAPYEEFYNASSKVPSREELIVFRKFLFRLADRIAQKSNALGIVSGDSVGQVASQTLHNLAAVNSAAHLPIYRPLVGMDKERIIEIAKKIGTYEISVQPYKDCCSLVAERHPTTRARSERIEVIEKKIDIEKIIEKTVKKIETIHIG
ncbi:MAG: tRNA uracil 4-sulfurtransferase ThiI [Candidatus Bilamarchaeaceae archaeon]